MSEHVTSLRTYFLIFLALLVLMVILILPFHV